MEDVGPALLLIGVAVFVLGLALIWLISLIAGHGWTAGRLTAERTERRRRQEKRAPTRPPDEPSRGEERAGRRPRTRERREGP